MPNRIEYRAFTMIYGMPVKKLITSVSMLPLLSLNNTASNTIANTEALWDTGATISCIKPALFERLRLRRYDTAGFTTITGIGGKIKAAVTLINLFLTPTFVIEDCPVYITDFPGRTDILIGMDIIGMGDFAVCNVDNKTSFSFAMPPFPDRINLAEKAESVNKINRTEGSTEGST